MGLLDGKVAIITGASKGIGAAAASVVILAISFAVLLAIGAAVAVPMVGCGGGSDDIGDVSWNYPTVTLRYPANIPGLPGHNWSSAIATRSWRSSTTRRTSCSTSSRNPPSATWRRR